LLYWLRYPTHLWYIYIMDILQDRLINKTCPNIFSTYTDILLLQERHVRRYEMVLMTQLRIARQYFSDWPSGAMQLCSARYPWDNSLFKWVSIDCVLRSVQPGKFAIYMKYIIFIIFFNLDKTASETYAISFLKKSADETMSRTWIFECYSLFKSDQTSFVDYEYSRHLSSSDT